MLEYPEIVTIAGQMRDRLPGRRIERAELAETGRKFVFVAGPREEFPRRLAGRTIARIENYSNHVYIVNEDGTGLQIGDTGGKLLLTGPGGDPPSRWDVRLSFADGAALTLSVQMWGFIEAFLRGGDAAHRERLAREGVQPTAGEMDRERFHAFLRGWPDAGRVNAKKFVTGRKFAIGLGNGYLQDILWRAGIHPRRKMDALSGPEADRLFDAILSVTDDAVAAGGRAAEFDLFNRRGGYHPVACRETLGKPCPRCGAPIGTFPFEGGACYVCPECQTY